VIKVAGSRVETVVDDSLRPQGILLLGRPPFLCRPMPMAACRYTVREALRRLRDDNPVTSRPRAGTLVVPRPSSESYAQEAVSVLPCRGLHNLHNRGFAAVLIPAELAVRAGTSALEVHRRYTTSDGDVAQVTINTHPAARFRHSMTLRRVRG